MFLNLLIEVILIAIIVGGTSFGYRKGLFKMVAAPARTLVCLVTSFLFGRPVGKYFLSPILSVPIKRYVLTFVSEKMAWDSGHVIKIPTIIKVTGAVFDISYDNAEITVESMVNSFTDPLVALVSCLIAFVLIFCLSKWLIKLLMNLTDSCLNIGVLGKLNRISGAVLSVFFAIICAFAFTSAVNYILRLDFALNSRLVREFSGGPLYRFFRNFNLINLLLSF